MITNWKCFGELIRKEIYLFSKEFLNRFIDTFIMLFAAVIVFAYFMSTNGLDKSYGAFFFIGSIASFGFYEVLWRSTLLAQDVIDKKIQNYLVLPLKSSHVFVAIATSWSITIASQIIVLLPFGKLILLDNFNLANFSIGKFILIFIVLNVFYGFFALWLASLITDLRCMSWFGARVLTPLLMFSCYYYRWESAYALSPIFGYIQLINPIVYAIEGSRAAVFGQAGYINYWVCLCVLVAVIGGVGADAIRRLKKRTDSI